MKQASQAITGFAAHVAEISMENQAHGRGCFRKDEAKSTQTSFIHRTSRDNFERTAD